MNDQSQFKKRLCSGWHREVSKPVFLRGFMRIQVLHLDPVSEYEMFVKNTMKMKQFDSVT